MTRETKIGLLVGLAFLLVVGILLSEHITGATERPAAPLADAGHGVRTGVSAPGMAADEPAKIAEHAIAEPRGPIPTAQDIAPAPKPPVTQVTIQAPAGSDPAAAQQITVQNGAVVTTTPLAPPAPAAPVKIAAPAVAIGTDPFANDPLARAAREHGEVVVPVDGRSGAAKPAVTTVANTTGAREYKAQAGDTLSRLAALLPGGNVKANRDAVVKLNPTLQKDPNRVVAGHAYLLPTTGATVQVTTITTETKTAEKAAADKAAADKAAIKVAKAPTPAPKAVVGDLTRTYVVKAGDTLSRIASAELGSKSEVGSIRTLNADVLKGTDVIKVDMKLKLPAKLMASVR